MTRKGSKQRDWTSGDIAYLVNNAGRLPKRTICRNLRRSSDSVESKAKWLRGKGCDISLRHYETRLRTCPACGNLSATIGRDGFCKPCRQREQLAAVHARISELLQLLPMEERDTYSETEAETESAVHAKPKAPDTRGVSLYERTKAEEEHVIALEEWAIRNLLRRIKAAQKRKERIERKVRSAGVWDQPR